MLAQFACFQVLATLIYTAGTLHAAVNFPQKTIMSFVPNTPGAMYAAAPTDKVRSCMERMEASKLKCYTVEPVRFITALCALWFVCE